MSKIKWFSIPDSARVLKCSPKTIRRRLDNFLSKGCPKLDLYYKKEDGLTGKVYLSKLLLDSNFDPPTTSNNTTQITPLQEEIKRLQKERAELVKKHKEEIVYWKDQNSKHLDEQKQLVPTIHKKALEEKQEQIDFLKGELEIKNGQLEKSHQEKLTIIERLRESNILLGNLQQEVKKLNSSDHEVREQGDYRVVAKSPKAIEILWLVVVVLLLVAAIVGLFMGI